jgi:acyl-homoserine-lactone acylase
VKAVRAAGFALDATLGSVQRPLITPEPIPLHGGDEFEGVLNNLGNQFNAGITPKGLLIDYGTSYVQTVTFDARGPVAQGMLTYGQSTNPASPHATDQLKLFSAQTVAGAAVPSGRCREGSRGRSAAAHAALSAAA